MGAGNLEHKNNNRIASAVCLIALKTDSFSTAKRTTKNKDHFLPP